MENLTGKQFGQYRIIEPLGEGGMAAVYKAYQPSVDRYVAIKVLPQQFAKDPNFISRFEQEARILAKLQHPHILPVYDHGQADGYTYIVMPLVAEGSLTDFLVNNKPTLTDIQRIISQIGDALDYAHSQGIVHRDIKPGNILIDTRGNCLLTDFGIAKMLENTVQLTVTGGILGTPAYMSPEQGLGETPDGRSDIYALGVILYEMATGRIPFKAETPLAVMMKHVSDPLPPPRTINPTIPEDLERIILKAMAKEPADRYATDGEMVSAIQKIKPDAEPNLTGGTSSQAQAIPPITPQGMLTQPSKNWLGLAMGGLILILFIGLSWVFLNNQPETDQPVLTSTVVLTENMAGDTTTTTSSALNPNPSPTVTTQPTASLTATPSPQPTEAPPTVTHTPSAVPATATISASPTPVTYDTDFPLPEDVRDFLPAAKSDQITFKTGLTVDELLQFYQVALPKSGWSEVSYLTQHFEGGFSIGFNHPDFEPYISVQVIDLGYSSTEDLRSVTINTRDLNP